MRPNAGPHVTRAAVESLLAAPSPKRSTVEARATALEAQAAQVAHFMGWPALVASLRSDAARLRAIL